MTDREKAIIMAYTGVVTLTGDKLGKFYEYCYDLLGRKFYTHEYLALADEIHRLSEPDFIKICEAEE